MEEDWLVLWSCCCKYFKWDYIIWQKVMNTVFWTLCSFPMLNARDQSEVWDLYLGTWTIQQSFYFVYVPYFLCCMFSTGVQTFRRDHDRFWVLAAHPNLNLFAAGKKQNKKKSIEGLGFGISIIRKPTGFNSSLNSCMPFPRPWRWHDCIQIGAWAACLCCAREHAVLCEGPFPPPAWF